MCKANKTRSLQRSTQTSCTIGLRRPNRSLNHEFRGKCVDVELPKLSTVTFQAKQVSVASAGVQSVPAILVVRVDDDCVTQGANNGPRVCGQIESVQSCAALVGDGHSVEIRAPAKYESPLKEKDRRLAKVLDMGLGTFCPWIYVHPVHGHRVGLTRSHCRQFV